MNKETEFVNFIRDHLKEYGFSLIFGRGVFLNVGGARCMGYFYEDAGIKEIRVAKKCKSRLYVVAHEYCHFLQWLESPKSQLKKESSAQFIVHEVSIGNMPDRWTDKQVTDAFAIIASLERDCERRTVKLLKEWNIPFDEDLYIRRANLYVYMHHMWKIYKTQRTKYDVDASRRALKMMPNTFRVQSHIKIPARVRKELSRAFFE